MILIVKYRGEIFWVKLETADKYLLSTGLMEKAEKVGFPLVERGGWEEWVPKKEVLVLGEEKALGLDGTLI